MNLYTQVPVSSSGENIMLEIMRCDLCGKLAMIVRDGGRRTICCDQLMEKLVEQGEGSGETIHVPVIEKTKTGIRVRVPAVENPMREEHYIEWIEVSKGKDLHVKGLSPGDAPEAEFPIKDANVKARVYCEQHGIWSNKPAKPKS